MTRITERARHTVSARRKRRLAATVRVSGCEACSALGKYGPCTACAARQSLGTDGLAAWSEAADSGILTMPDGQSIRVGDEMPEDTPEDDVHVVYVAPAVAAMYAIGADCVTGIEWTPDGLAAVSYVHDTPEAPARARLVPFGLLASEESMRAAVEGRESWTRWDWRTRKGRAPMSVRCRCGQTTDARWKHACAFTASNGRNRDGVTPPDCRTWVAEERAEARKATRAAIARKASEARSVKARERREAAATVDRRDLARDVMHAPATFAEAQALADV